MRKQYTGVVSFDIEAMEKSTYTKEEVVKAIVSDMAQELIEHILKDLEDVVEGSSV